MFLLIKKFNFNPKKIFLAFFCSFFLTYSSFSENLPASLSKNTKISILSVSYNDISHSLFSKSCLRIYDKENQFDKIIDFAFFHDFNDKFFGLKFFLKNKKASIMVMDFFNYFLEQNEQKNVSLTESLLDLSPEEIAYIYDFIFTLYKALPEYSYDFDVLTNNSETHISQILHDCYRMAGNKAVNEEYSFSSITKHNLNYKKINDSYVLLSESENLSLTEQNFSHLLESEKQSLLIILIIVSAFFFLATLYQILVYFFEKLHISSIYKSIQIFDFMVLFSAGLSGLIIVFQDLFSNQAMLRNNFQFLFLFPLHLLAAFSVFKSNRTRKTRIIYWSLTSFLSVIYVLINSILKSELSLVCLLFVLPIFFRTLYFDFLAIDIKKALAKKPALKN